jgi:large subunit ribosomal protein L9
MAKTEVILTHNVIGLGGESDQVKVAAGYARNYLFPQRLAIPVTAANKRRLEVLRQRRTERESRELSTMTELGQALSKLTLVIRVKTGDDGKLFGSVTAGTIADELKHQFDASVDKRKIHLSHPIKNVGDHEVELRLHAQVQTSLKVRIESTTPAPTPVEAPAPESKDREPGRRREGRREHAPREQGQKEEGRSEAGGKPERKPRAPKAEKAE